MKEGTEYTTLHLKFFYLNFVVMENSFGMYIAVLNLQCLSNVQSCRSPRNTNFAFSGVVN